MLSHFCLNLREGLRVEKKFIFVCEFSVLRFRLGLHFTAKSFTSDSSKHLTLEGALPIEAARVVRIVDEFELEVQASGFHFL